ncbi:GNAT family N-acetyltransferase [Streptococcaceae bacterium ESL0729]|nr:GNAT family N-acetyltransferase [Streptococcaceae bacterium ESL0729]
MENSNFKIRPVEAIDLDHVMRLELDNFGRVATTRAAMEERINKTPDTFYVAEIDGKLVGYLEGAVIADKYLTDDLFSHVDKNPEKGGYFAITSLSVDKKVHGQSIGTKLLTFAQNEARKKSRAGITLTCHDYLLGYYEKYGFKNEGKSASNLGGEEWYNMLWEID